MFDDVRFPEDISYVAFGGPCFSTSVSRNISGIEERNINWSNGLAKYKIEGMPLSKDRIDELISFFRARMGMGIGFRFKDWADFSGVVEVVKTESLAQSFQITKTYQSGKRSYVRKITKPLEETLVVKENGTKTADFNIKENGIIEIASTVGIGSKVTIEFEFDVPVRFGSDDISVQPIKRNSWIYSPIEIVEIIV